MSDTESKRIFQRRFRELLEREHISQKVIADICDVSTSTVSTWYKGINIPRMDKIERLANHFGLPKSYFIEESLPSEQPFFTPDEESLLKMLVANGPADISKIVDRVGNLSEEEQDTLFILSIKMVAALGQGRAILADKSRTPPSTVTESPQAAPAPQEGKDTTPPADAPETAPEGE